MGGDWGEDHAPQAQPGERGATVKAGYRLILVDHDGVMVSEFQLTERDLADPPAFVAAIKQSIEQVEDEEP
jgi:hypothetical protein